MIPYKEASIRFAFQLRGSVGHRVIFWIITSAMIASGAHFALAEWYHDDGATARSGLIQALASYNFILGFLLVFRTTSAYNRFWEGVTLMQQLRAAWFNSMSSLFAFTTKDPTKQAEVEQFQHCMVRLMSLLFSKALEQLMSAERCNLEVIDPDGLSREHQDYINKKVFQMEIALGWMQRTIIEKHWEKILDVPPPILTRALQDLGTGFAHALNAKKLSDTPFPFPYAQMLTYMLLISWLVTPWVMAMSMEQWWEAAIISAITNPSLWAIYYIAVEIEAPFGHDSNDLPLQELQIDMNLMLCDLLDKCASTPPVYAFSPDHRRCKRIVTETPGSECHSWTLRKETHLREEPIFSQILSPTTEEEKKEFRSVMERSQSQILQTDQTTRQDEGVGEGVAAEGPLTAALAAGKAKETSSEIDKNLASLVDIGMRVDDGLDQLSRNIALLCTRGLEMTRHEGTHVSVKPDLGVTPHLGGRILPPEGHNATSVQSLEELGRRAEEHLLRIARDVELMANLASRYSGGPGGGSSPGGGTQAQVPSWLDRCDLRPSRTPAGAGLSGI